MSVVGVQRVVLPQTERLLNQLVKQVMKKWFNKNMHFLIGSLLGAIAGFLYWQQIGCITGTCAISSDPINSSIYGGVMGSLIAGLFKKEHKREEFTDKTYRHDIKRNY